MKKILILGGGFGGVYSAKRLQKLKPNSFEIELISNNNYFIFQPLLPEVASGTIPAGDAVTPIRQMLPNIKFRHAEITKIDCNQKNVVVVQGLRRREHLINFDHLVIALGQESNKQIIPGLKHHCFTMRTLEDAYNIRNHLIGCFELADVTLDKELKRKLLNIVVVGGGFSGVETTGELKEMSDRLLPYYKNIKKNELKFHIVEFSSRLLPELSKEISDYTYKIFKNRDINVYLKTALRNVFINKVFLSNGKSIDTKTIISTIGSTVSKIINKSGLPLKNGKIITNEFLEVKGFKDIWAIGDSALIPNKIIKSKYPYSPPTAQFAVRQANILAKNIVLRNLMKNLRKFEYKSKGSLASLGSKKGVGKIYFLNVKGILGWVIWRIFYLSFIPSFPTKLRVLFSWILEFFIPRNAVLTQPYKGDAVSYKVFRKGDIVFEEGMIADGFYIIKEGEFENIYRMTKTGKVFKKIYKKGSHFGSRVLLEGGRRTGTIKARKDSLVLRIDSSSFKLLAENFPVLDKYFGNYLPKTFKNLRLREN